MCDPVCGELTAGLAMLRGKNAIDSLVTSSGQAMMHNICTVCVSAGTQGTSVSVNCLMEQTQSSIDRFASCWTCAGQGALHGSIRCTCNSCPATPLLPAMCFTARAQCGHAELCSQVGVATVYAGSSRLVWCAVASPCQCRRRANKSKASKATA